MAGQNFPVAVMARRAAALAGVIRDGGTEVEIASTLREFGEDVSTVDPAAVPLLQQVADELYAVFAAETLDTCVGEINGMLGRWAGPPRLSAHDGTAWHLHLDSDDEAPWGEWLAASAAYALANIVGETGRRPGGICHAEGCDRPYVNTGAGAEQRYCSPRCATRSRVAAHRRRTHG
jgi:hypothetical protein